MLGGVLTAHEKVFSHNSSPLFQVRSQPHEEVRIQIISANGNPSREGPLLLKVGYVTAVAVKGGDHKLVTTGQSQEATCT
jgi:hypothetical protein